jgi:hypothetical protein
LRKNKPSASTISTLRIQCLLNDDFGKTGIGANGWSIKQQTAVYGVRIAPEDLATPCRSGS